LIWINKSFVWSEWEKRKIKKKKKTSGRAKVICQFGIVKGTSVTRLDMSKNKVFNYGMKPTEMVVQGGGLSFIHT
jgi:hypothetical protein